MDVVSVIMGVLMLLGIELKSKNGEPANWSRTFIVAIWILCATALIIGPLILRR